MLEEETAPLDDSADDVLNIILGNNPAFVQVTDEDQVDTSVTWDRMSQVFHFVGYDSYVKAEWLYNYDENGELESIEILDFYEVTPTEVTVTQYLRKDPV